jgi:large subunit ribosomal protein L21
MLTRNLRRALLDSRWSLPPTFLLPWAAHLTTTSHTIEADNLPPPPNLRHQILNRQSNTEPSKTSRTPRIDIPQASSAPSESLPPPNALSSPPALSSSVRDLLPLLQAQSPHYITLHIHGKPYLLTQGDTLRLPFLMHGVEPGDVLRMNRAINIGCRDYTLKAAAAAPKLRSTTHDTRLVVDPTQGAQISQNQAMPSAESSAAPPLAQGSILNVPHFIQHIEKGKQGYLD